MTVTCQELMENEVAMYGSRDVPRCLRPAKWLVSFKGGRVNVPMCGIHAQPKPGKMRTALAARGGGG